MADSVPIPSPTVESALAVPLAVGAMLVVSAAIGVFFFRKNRSFDDWAVGHGDVGPLVTGLALTATWLSGWAIFGNAGLGYTYGWSGTWLIGGMNLMGLSLCVVLGYRMRRYAALGARTVPEVARVRFDSRLVQGLAGIAMVILLIVYSVGQYKAMASVWKLTTGTDWLVSLLITAVLCAAYIMVGGYAGTQLSLALQGAIFMAIGWIFGLASIFWAGGPDKIAEAIASSNFVKPGGDATSVPIGGYTSPIAPSFPGYDWIGVTAAMFMFLFMATGFPHNIARFLGTRKVTKKEYGAIMLVVALNCVTPLMVGAMGYAARAVWGPELMKSGPIYGDAAASLVSMAIGGTAGAAVFSMAVFSAAVSSLAGMVMIMATNVSRDLVQNVAPKMSKRATLALSRLLVIPFVLIPLWWTYTSPPPVLSEFMSGSAVAQGGIFFFVIAVSMYWRRATKWGAVATIVYGMAFALLHPNVYGKLYPPFNHWGIWALALMFGCAAVYVLVSLVTKPLPEEKLAKLFGKKEG
ncbi:MAG: sodium:solute symporter [Candidatus Verstraetearchaeota archaeon]|nr:sodium:solute symporter [Candidatus Verstraetearchaeota archaeon]